MFNLTNEKIHDWPKIGQLYKVKRQFSCFYKHMPTFDDFIKGNNDVLPKIQINDVILILGHKIKEETSKNFWRKSYLFYFLYNNKICWSHLTNFEHLEEIVENDK